MHPIDSLIDLLRSAVLFQVSMRFYFRDSSTEQMIVRRSGEARLSSHQLRCGRSTPSDSLYQTHRFVHRSSLVRLVLILEIGAVIRDQFNTAFVTHLVHCAIDKGETPTGFKAKNAIESATPIIGIEWVKEFAEAAARARDSAAIQPISATEKGKGRMVKVEDEKVEVASLGSRVLAGYSFLLSSRLDEVRPALPPQMKHADRLAG